jgi:hypothetical protein
MTATATRVAVANDLLYIALIPYRSPRRLVALILVILVREPVIFRSRFKLIRRRARFGQTKSDVFFTHVLRQPYTQKL